MAKAMVTRYGMSENLGLISYGNDDDEVFIGKDFAHSSRGYAEDTASKIDAEIKSIIDDCYKKAKDLILQHKNVLEKCAALLIEKEKIGTEEFEALFNEA